jgi:hypothetical protein
MTFEDIAAARDLDVNETKRFLRLAMTNYVFTEPREGVVGHSACSKVLAENRYAAAWLGHAVENVWPTLPRVLDASEKWPGSERPNETVSQPHFRHDNKRILIDLGICIDAPKRTYSIRTS